MKGQSEMITDPSGDSGSQGGHDRGYDFRGEFPLSDSDLERLVLLEKYADFEWFVEVLTLNSGQSFGELALLQDKPRAASIVAETDCHFALLGRRDYERILEKIERKETEAKVQFFK